jgi:Leucine-rich repeat (LRR) protein
MLEFRVNDFIKLKLGKDGITDIYVFGKKFIQCKFLLMNIPIRETGLYDEINSIDEAVEKLDKSLDLGNLEGYEIRKKIPPEVEFWGHCSNLQVWAEQNYDTSFIHSNLAFPLLKKLTEVGDPKAEISFKDEIGKRFEEGPDSVRQYLVLEGYMDYLTREEMWSAMPNQSDVKILNSIEKELKAEFKLCSDEKDELGWDDLVLGDKLVRKLNPLGFSMKDGSVNRIGLFNFKTLSIGKLQKFFNILRKLTTLEELDLSCNDIKKIPDNIRGVKSLKALRLNHNALEDIPESIGDLELLERLNLSNNKIKMLPESIGKLNLLEELHINHNQLEILPDSIGNLKFLVKLFLKDNLLKNLPDTIMGMKSLKKLALNNNLLLDLPEKMIYMESLTGIGLEDNKNFKKNSLVVATLEKKGTYIKMNKKNTKKN